MIKKTAILFVEFLLILFLGIILVIAFTGGFSWSLGSLKIKAHNFKNPLIVLFGALILRRVLAGNFFREFISLRLIKRLGISITLYSERLISGVIELPLVRKRVIPGLFILLLITLIIIVYKPLQPGLTGIYYHNREWTGEPLIAARDSTFDVSRMKSEFPAITENYSIQWAGVIFLPVSGEYQFSMSSDDGSELYIRDQMIVDNRGLHGAQERTGTVYLKKGFHSIRIRYMQGFGGAGIEVYWKRPGSDYEFLSHALLFPQEPNAVSFRMYLIKRTLLPVLMALWILLFLIIGIGTITRVSGTRCVWNKISPVTVKLFVFFLINGLVVNAILSFFSHGMTEDGPVVRDINVGLYCTHFFVRSPTHDRLDSWKYLYNALKYLSEPQEKTLYSELYFNQRMKFQYPPTSVLLFEPFKGLSLEEFITTANFLSWIAIIITIGILSRIFSVSMQQYNMLLSEKSLLPGRLARLSLACCFTITFYPLMWSFRLGQIQTWIYFLFILVMWAWMSGNKVLSGTLTGIICIIKPQLGLLGLWGILRKQWGFVGGLGGTVGILGIISLYRYGLANHLEYLQFLSYMSKYGESYYPNQSVNGLLHRLLFNGPNVYPDIGGYPPYNPWVHAGTLISSFILILTALFWKRNYHHQAEMSDFSIAALSFTMASPIAWMHHYSVMLPMFAIAFSGALSSHLKKRWIGILTISFMLSSNFYYVTNYLANTRFNFLQSLLFWGALLLLIYLYQLRESQQTNAKNVEEREWIRKN